VTNRISSLATLPLNHTCADTWSPLRGIGLTVAGVIGIVDALTEILSRQRDRVAIAADLCFIVWPSARAGTERPSWAAGRG